MAVRKQSFILILFLLLLTASGCRICHRSRKAGETTLAVTAQGNEPGWQIRIGGTTEPYSALLVSSYGRDTFTGTFRITEKNDSVCLFQGQLFRAGGQPETSDKNSSTVLFHRENCSDDAGRPFTAAVVVSTGSFRLRGCGDYPALKR